MPFGMALVNGVQALDDAPADKAETPDLSLTNACHNGTCRLRAPARGVRRSASRDLIRRLSALQLFGSALRMVIEPATRPLGRALSHFTSCSCCRNPPVKMHIE